jgi:hypothetical protein
MSMRGGLKDKRVWKSVKMSMREVLKDKKGSGICKNVLERSSQGQKGYGNL